MKKTLSPLWATVLLLAFSILIGVVVMNWGKDYIASLSQIEPAKESPAAPGSIQQICLPDDPFTILQARYANGEITTAKYLEMRSILTNNAINSS